MNNLLKRGSGILVIGIFTFITLIGLSLLLNEGEGEIITVDDDGGADYPKIQWAIDNATDGDTIRVFAGEYNESLTVNKSIDLIGNGSDSTTVYRYRNGSGSPGTIVYITANNTSFSGFNISKTREYWRDGVWTWEYWRDGVWIYLLDSYGEVFVASAENCTLENNVGSIKIWGVVNCTLENNAGSISIMGTENCTLENNTSSIYINSGKNIQVLNNIIKGYGSQLAGNDLENCLVRGNVFLNRSEGLRIDGDRNSIIERNMFENGSYYYSPRGGLIVIDGEGTLIKDNILNGTFSGLSLHDSSRIRIMSNLFAGTNDAITLDSSTNIQLIGNTLMQTSLLMSGKLLEHWNTHTIEGSNSFNGMAITYLANLSNEHLVGLQGPLIVVNCNNMTFSDLNCSNGYAGFILARSSGITIRNSTFFSNSHTALKIVDNSILPSDPILVSSCEFTGNEASISLINSPNVIISSNVIKENAGDGIYITGTINYETMVRMSNNTIANNTGTGIVVYSFFVEIRENVITGNMNNGISLRDEASGIIASNNCSWNGNNGIYTRFLSREGIEVIGNECVNNTLHGLGMSFVSNGMIESNILPQNGYSGISGDSVHNNTFRNNTCWDNTEHGIYLNDSSGNRLMNNTLANNSIGLNLEGWTYQNSVINNTIVGNDIGINLIDLAVTNSIRENAIVNNRFFGLNSSVDIDQNSLTMNWWGNPYGPYNPSDNPHGGGDPISDMLDFEPWLKEWHDPTLVRDIDPPTSDTDTEEDDEIDSARFLLMLILVVFLAFVAVLVLIIVLPERSKGGSIRLQSRPNRPKKLPLSDRSADDPKKDGLSSEGNECSRCGKSITLDTDRPSIHLTCPHCGKESLNEQFQKEASKLYKP